MPVMDGFEATKEITKISSDNTPIVALTAYDAETFKEKCMKAGMKDFITKPVDSEKLVDLLRRLEFIC